jgi:1-acyl-sn-glycerol-3-phosphate acyltransferase
MLPSSWRRWLWYNTGYWVFALLYYFGYSYRFFGQHRVPRSGPVLIIANHESFWDPPMVGIAMPRRVAFMARKTLYNSKALAKFMENVGTFAVDQEGTGLEGIRIAIKKLQDGEAVVLFPEGSRTPDGSMKEFMPGVALLVRKAKVPVVPVGLAGSYDGWPVHAKKPKWSPLWSPRRAAAMTVVVGQPIPAETLLPMEPRKMVEYLRDRVADARAEAYRRKGVTSRPG